MEKGEQSFANVWDIDVEKYNADESQVEEVAAEDITEDGIPEGKQAAEPEGSEEAKQDDDAVPGKDTGVEDAVEKQGEESEESEKDASIETPVKEEPSGTADIDGLVDDLVKDEILDFEDDKDYSLGEKGLKEVIADTVEKRSIKALEAFKDNLGDDGKKLLAILDKGGSVDDFVKMDQQTSFGDVQLENDKGEQFERNQQYLVSDWLKVQGHTPDEIDDIVNDYQKAGLLRKQAEMSQRKLTTWQADQNETLLAQKEQTQIENTRIANEEAEQFQEDILGTRDIAGFKVTESKAKKLYDFITVADKEGNTSLAKNTTPENQLLFALFAMEGFDKDKLSKEIATKQARKISRKLGNYTDKNVDPKRGATRPTRTDQVTPKIHWQM